MVPMATVSAGSTPPHPSIPLVAPPLPVQNGPATGNKVQMERVSGDGVVESKVETTRAHVREQSREYEAGVDIVFQSYYISQFIVIKNTAERNVSGSSRAWNPFLVSMCVFACKNDVHIS